jgi:sRNA-binding carbon storage regulator CsrA
LHLGESKALGEGRGNTFIVFPKRGRKEIAVEAGNSRVVRELRRELYQRAKQELRKPLEEDNRKAVFGKTERAV